MRRSPKIPVFILSILSIFLYAGILMPNENNKHDCTTNTKFPIPLKDIIARFSLVEKNPDSFSIGLAQSTIEFSEENKNYIKPFWDITKFNMLVWAFDRYALHGNWTNISFQSISNNLKTGLVWDYDDFGTNQFGHAYHGAMYHSIARSQGMNFFESALFTFLGSLSWEYFWESENPGKNDHLYSTFGGINLGEALFRMANLVSTEKTIGKAVKFFINPIVGIKKNSGNDFSPGFPSGKHYYDFKIPFGALHSPGNQFTMFVATLFENKDIFHDANPKISPYDWFTFNAQIGINEIGFRDPEISTYGILFGKKFQNGCAGLFGLFDYINTQVAEKMSAVGFGPGFATSSSSESRIFLNTSGILSMVFGSSSATIPYSEPNYEAEGNEPYHFGPGIMGRIKLELGKKGLGSLNTGFSQYWVHATLADANEFMSVVSLDLNYDMSERSQISFGYDYYLRNANLEEQKVTKSKNAIRAMYIINF